MLGACIPAAFRVLLQPIMLTMKLKRADTKSKNA